MVGACCGVSPEQRRHRFRPREPPRRDVELPDAHPSRAEGVVGAFFTPAQRRRVLFERSGPDDQVGGARAHLVLEHLAVLIVIVAVGLEAQEVPYPHAELGTIHGLGRKSSAPALSPSIRAARRREPSP